MALRGFGLGFALLVFEGCLVLTGFMCSIFPSSFFFLIFFSVLVLAGNAPVTVTGLDEGGAAEASGLVVGDVFLGLNGEAVYFLPQREVVARIKQCGFQPISLHVKTVSVLLGVGQGRGIEPVRNCRLGRGGGSNSHAVS